MNVYYKNNIADLDAPTPIQGTYLENVYDKSLELPVMFNEEKVTIEGNYGLSAAAVDSLCLGYTNAFRYTLTLYDSADELIKFSGLTADRITIRNFEETLFFNRFELILEGIESVYLGYLYLGMKTTLPRFEVKPDVGEKLLSQSSQSFGGQVFGLRRTTLKSFSVNFPRITSEERDVFIEYIKSVLNIEPHIIDPYYEAHDKFPPMYAYLDINDNNMPKLNEHGFYYSTSLKWQEAR